MTGSSWRRALLAPFPLAIAVLLALTACSKGEETWYLIEQDGVPVGHQTITSYAGDPAKGRPSRKELQIVIRSTLLGGNFDIRVREEREMDSSGTRPIRIEGEMSAGDLALEAVTVFEGDSAYYTPKSGGSPAVLPCGPEVVLSIPYSYAFLLEDSTLAEGDSRSFRVFDPALGRIEEVAFTLAGEETLSVAEGERACLVFDQENEALGVHQRAWIDRNTGELVQNLSPDGMLIVRATRDATRNVGRFNMDERIFAPVDLEVENYRDISSMKVRARIRSVGQRITPAGLNHRGQTFEGTVEDNLIDGTFLVEHADYAGEDAPPFPPDWSDREDLVRFLAPEILVESDDPALVEEASRITAGATDSWEAALLLSRWVSQEIEPAIPGASARRTYDTRKGECAGHARLLTAFCRGVGIPTRIVSGCMYTPIQGGSFGQHVWNEVYMGEDAGWVPIDSAVEEPEFIDSGHIRLGGLVTFRPEEMEVLDYRLRKRD